MNRTVCLVAVLELFPMGVILSLASIYCFPGCCVSFFRWGVCIAANCWRVICSLSFSCCCCT